MGWLGRLLGLSSRQRDNGRLRMSFDAAGSSKETIRHWEKADGLAADSACHPGVRATLRNRGRHEYLNNPYTYGSTYTIANDVVGIGPRLQMLTPNEIVNKAVERSFSSWARAIGLGRKLRLMRRTRVNSGECFIRLIRNPKVKHPVKLDVQLIEPDQVATPYLFENDENFVDGIEFDSYGNPLFYHVLKRHPGDFSRWTRSATEYDRIPASEILHYFRPDRPGQSRGIPEIVSSMNLQAERRSMRQSVISAARVAAGMGAITIESELSGDENSIPEEFDTFEIEAGMMTTLPAGMKAKQIEPTQPGTTYGDFDDRLISEQGRPLNMPKNVMKADSSNYNYASGRLDHQTYDRANVIDQDDIEDICLRPIIQRWALMATEIPNLLPARARQVYLPTPRDPEWQVECVWHWSERDHVDPGKEASATAENLRTLTTTYASEYAKQRLDWRDEFAQRGREQEELDANGLLKIDPQSAAAIANVLQRAASIGREAAIGLLTLLSVPQSKAETMVDSAIEATPKPAAPIAKPVSDNGIPPAIAARMNGNGVVHA